MALIAYRIVKKNILKALEARSESTVWLSVHLVCQGTFSNQSWLDMQTKINVCTYVVHARKYQTSSILYAQVQSVLNICGLNLAHNNFVFQFPNKLKKYTSIQNAWSTFRQMVAKNIRQSNVRHRVVEVKWEEVFWRWLKKKG